MSKIRCSAALWVVALLLPALSPFVVNGDEKGEKEATYDFELKDTEGKTVKLSGLEDKYVVLEWIEPACPTCKRHARDATMNHLVKKYAKKKEVVFLGICTSSTTDAASMKSFMEKHKLQYRVLMDPTGKVGNAFKAKKTPHMYIVKNGKKLYEGAMDDDSRGKKAEAERVNYIAQALDEALAGKKISASYTRPYG